MIGPSRDPIALAIKTHSYYIPVQKANQSTHLKLNLQYRRKVD